MALRKGETLRLLLVFGLVFSTATQLRLPGYPIGLGEALLLCWLAMTTKQTSNWHSPEVRAVAIFVLSGALLLASGYNDPYPESYSRPSPLHDSLAYLFCATLAINFSRLKQIDAKQILILFLAAFLASFVLALLLGWVGHEWTRLDVFYGGERWQHLSINPNQFALLALALPFLSIHVISGKTEKVWFPFVVGVLGVLLGLYSRSDALAVAWTVGGLIAIVGLARWNNGKRKKNILILLILMTIGSVWQLQEKIQLQKPFPRSTPTPTPTPTPTQNIFFIVKAFLPCQPELKIGEKYQANVRFCLWKHAIDVIELKPLTGWGPGAHSGIDKPFIGEEAHNIFLDWASQSGLIGLTALAVYLLWLSIKLLLSGRYEFFAMFVALLVFSMFHYTLRQPLFWLLPLIALKLSEQHPAQQSVHAAGNNVLKRCAA